MDRLTRYVIDHYSELMTVREQAAYKTILWTEKMLASDTDVRREMIKRNFISSDPEVKQMLAEGPADCLDNIRKRILRDNADKVFLNYCPLCQGLVPS